MRILRSIAILCLGLAAGCGGGTRACKSGTLLVHVTLDEPADTLDISVTTGGGQPITATAPLPSGTSSGTIEVDFPSGYPAGQSVTVAITASSAGGPSSAAVSPPRRSAPAAITSTSPSALAASPAT